MKKRGDKELYTALEKKKKLRELLWVDLAGSLEKTRVFFTNDFADIAKGLMSLHTVKRDNRETSKWE